jgi:hypothetical protein
MALYRKNAGGSVFDPIEAGKSDDPSVHPSFLDTMPLRWCKTVAALSSLPAAGCQVVQGNGGLLVSRCVGNSIYASQNKSTQGRRHFEACKLRLRLGGVASVTEPFPERPRGMHRSTYARLQRRGAKLESGLSARLRTKPADYPNLVYYFQS